MYWSPAPVLAKIWPFSKPGQYPAPEKITPKLDHWSDFVKCSRNANSMFNLYKSLQRLLFAFVLFTLIDLYFLYKHLRNILTYLLTYLTCILTELWLCLYLCCRYPLTHWLLHPLYCQLSVASTSWNLYWCRPDNVDASHSADLFEVFCCSSTATKRTVVSIKWSVTVVCHSTGILGLATLASLQKQLLYMVQSMQNTAARLILFSQLDVRTASSLYFAAYTGFVFLNGRSFQLAVLVYHCQSSQPDYLCNMKIRFIFWWRLLNFHLLSWLRLPWPGQYSCHVVLLDYDGLWYIHYHRYMARLSAS